MASAQKQNYNHRLFLAQQLELAHTASCWIWIRSGGIVSFPRNVLSHSCGSFPPGLCNTVSLSDQLSDICIKPPNTWKTSGSNSVNKARHRKRAKNKRYIVNVWFTHIPPMKLHRQFHCFSLPGTHSSLFLWLEVKNPQFQVKLSSHSCHISL